jgi:hypothetical protein
LIAVAKGSATVIVVDKNDSATLIVFFNNISAFLIDVDNDLMTLSTVDYDSAILVVVDNDSAALIDAVMKNCGEAVHTSNSKLKYNNRETVPDSSLSIHIRELRNCSFFKPKIGYFTGTVFCSTGKCFPHYIPGKNKFGLSKFPVSKYFWVKL